jgi:hypothetical protein
MNAKNTPKIARILKENRLQVIPEAHNFLRIENTIVDCTKQNWTIENFQNDVLSEIEIQPFQISDWKVNYHLAFLEQWLSEQKNSMLSVKEIWQIREECIEAL